MLAKVAAVLERLREIFSDEGVTGVLVAPVRYVHWHVLLPYLPHRRATYNGVETDAARVLDSVVPYRKLHKPDYESGLVTGLERHAEPGDHVVLVGGGWGVTAVTAARQVGDSGTVTVYEGSKEQLSHLEKTFSLNEFPSVVTVTHAVVGEAVSLYGPMEDADRIGGDELPDCDVLELDCEGSEIDILENLTVRPRVILVESHGHYGAPTDRVEAALRQQSYEVVSTGVADLEAEADCRKKDNYVITARRE